MPNRLVYPSLIARSLLIALLAIAARPPHANAAEKAIMKVVLNTMEMGDYFLMVSDGGVILMKTGDLLDMGFQKIPEGAGIRVGDEEYVPLSSFGPLLKYETDEAASAVRLTANPALLKKNTVDLAYRASKKVYAPRAYSGFLNYGAAYSMDSDFGFTSLSVPLEAGVSAGGPLFLSNFSYSKTKTEESIERLSTSLTLDDPPSSRRYVLGDFFSSTGTLGGGTALGGISIAKNFSMTPYFVKTPPLNVSGFLTTPSEVEVYVNGNLVKTETLPPGEFELLNIPNASGTGEIAVVVKDALGRVERIESAFYLSSLLLKPGLHEYSYGVGFERKDFGTESFKYGSPAFTARHRVGLAGNFTAGGRAEAGKDLYSLGPELTLQMAWAGEINSSASFSKAGSKEGYAGTIVYSNIYGPFNGRLSATTLSREYANLSLPAERDRARFDGSATLGFSNKWLGSTSVSYSRTDNYTATDSRRLSLYYSRRLFWDVSLFVTASRTKSDKTVNDLFLGLNALLGNNTSGGVNYGRQDRKESSSAYLQMNPPAGTGAGYRVSADMTDDSSGGKDYSYSADAHYRGSYGVFTGSVRNSAGTSTYSVGASGALAFINGSVYPSRPIYDSFALVKVGAIPDVRVSLSNQEAGVTGGRGEVLVPGLISYYENTVSIDDKDIPVNYSISEIAKTVSPPLRGGPW